MRDVFFGGERERKKTESFVRKKQKWDIDVRTEVRRVFKPLCDIGIKNEKKTRKRDAPLRCVVETLEPHILKQPPPYPHPPPNNAMQSVKTQPK